MKEVRINNQNALITQIIANKQQKKPTGVIKIYNIYFKNLLSNIIDNQQRKILIFVNTHHNLLNIF